MPDNQPILADISVENLDKAFISIDHLKGMFGAVGFLVNPDGSNSAYPVTVFESWFDGIQNKLDELIELLHCE